MSHTKMLVCVMLCVFGLGVLLPIQAQDDALNTMFQAGLNQVTVGNQLRSEDFRVGLGYAISSDTDVKREIVNEQYQIEVFREEWVAWDYFSDEFANVVIQADVNLLNNVGTNAVAGITCRMTDEDQGYGYYFEIDFESGYYVSVWSPETFYTLASGVNTTALQPGKTAHHLVAVCIDDYLAFYANGVVLAELVDTTLKSGLVSWSATLYAGTQSFGATFDNINVYDATVSSPLASSPTPDLSSGFLNVAPQRHLLSEPFDSVDAWFTYSDERTDFTIEDGLYSARMRESGFTWATNGTEVVNSIIEVDVTQVQTNTDANGIGLMCRVNNDGDGYFFWFGDDGFYNISVRQQATEEVFTALVDSEEVSLLSIDSGVAYRFTVVCVDNYLAMYVDGNLVAEAFDSTFSLGVTGLAISLSGDDPSIEQQVIYDNLNVWSASASG